MTVSRSWAFGRSGAGGARVAFVWFVGVADEWVGWRISPGRCSTPSWAAAGLHEGVFDRVFQLADVAGPGVIDQQSECVGVYAIDRPAGLGPKALDEVLDEQWDVVAALAEGRQVYGDHTQAIEQVVAESAGLNQLGQRAVGGGDDADIDVDGAIIADTLERAFLEHTQQLDLNRRRDIADFVKEDRAAVGRLESARLVADGTGERTAYVSEEFALQE